MLLYNTFLWHLCLKKKKKGSSNNTQATLLHGSDYGTGGPSCPVPYLVISGSSGSLEKPLKFVILYPSL